MHTGVSFILILQRCSGRFLCHYFIAKPASFVIVMFRWYLDIDMCG